MTAFSWTFPKDVSQNRLAVPPGEIHQQPHRPDRINPDQRRTGTSLPFCKILGKTPRLLSPGSRELKGDGIPASPPPLHSEPVASDADVIRQRHGPVGLSRARRGGDQESFWVLLLHLGWVR